MTDLKKNPPTMFRQGDVLLVAIDSVPDGAEPMPRDARGVVLAEGEVTGHAHRIPSRHASLYRSETDARFLRVRGPAPVASGVALQHEEHSTIALPLGDYRVVIHSEYQPGPVPVRRVED